MPARKLGNPEDCILNIGQLGACPAANCFTRVESSKNKIGNADKSQDIQIPAAGPHCDLAIAVLAISKSLEK